MFLCWPYNTGEMRHHVGTRIVLLLATSCFLGTQCQDDDPKVLILGAGMAGITAAKTLTEKGFDNFLVIEGSDRVGGRMKSVPFSDFTVEHGAFWIYAKGSNPAYALVNEYGMSIKRDKDDWTVRDKSGSDVTDLADKADRRLFRAINASEGFVENAINQGLPDLSLQSRLRHFGWDPTTPIEEAVEVATVDWEYAVPPAVISGKEFGYFNTFKEYGNDQLFFVNDPNGYGHLPKLMADDYIPPDRILFNKKVTRVKQDSEGVVITTEDGSRYRGDYVISTFSLGVMQHREVSFSPALPDCKQLAIDKMVYVLYSHMYLKFPNTFWDDTTYIVYASGDRARNSGWVNLNAVHKGVNTLQLAFYGDEVRRLDRLTDDEVIDDVLATLQTIYPNATIPRPINFTRPGWAFDPLFYGSWSEWTPDFTRDNFNDMNAPFGRLYFAGEHLAQAHSGFVHGAYESGEATAETLAECLMDPSACPADPEEVFVCSDIAANIDTGRFG